MLEVPEVCPLAGMWALPGHPRHVPNMGDALFSVSVTMTGTESRKRGEKPDDRSCGSVEHLERLSPTASIYLFITGV